MAPSSALPIGASRTVSELLPLHIDPSSPSSGLLNSVLALLASTASDGEQYDEELTDLPVRGFVIVYVHDIFNLFTPVREAILKHTLRVGLGPRLIFLTAR
jgi:polyribonucleotide 5'-hydroxyl-kinase